MKITIKNADKIQHNLNNYEKSIVPKLNAALTESALFLEGEIKDAISGRRPPLPRRVDTGNYMSKTRSRLKKDRVAEVYNDVEYGVYVEYGTSKMKPGQHFRVSLDRNAKKIEKFVQDAIKI